MDGKLHAAINIDRWGIVDELLKYPRVTIIYIPQIGILVIFILMRNIKFYSILFSKLKNHNKEKFIKEISTLYSFC